MSNLDTHPDLEECRSEPRPARFTEGLTNGTHEQAGEEYIVEILEPRPVPLGGPRAMSVNRVLPQRQRSLIGGWCFVDAYGPDNVADSGGMHVARHPHTGLATVSWLFEGRINHMDSAGHWATVRPGEVNLMNAGSGITHSEISTEDTTVLYGVQFWYAFPDKHRFVEPSLEAHRPEVIKGEGWRARVMTGTLFGQTSPVKTYTPLVGAELRLEAGAELTLDVDPNHEHGLLVIEGEPSLAGASISTNHLGYLGTGVSAMTIKAGEEPVLAMFIGGEPLNEDIIMWWNFVGRTPEEIKTWRAAYQEEMGFDAPSETSPLHSYTTQPLKTEVHGELLDQTITAKYGDGRVFPQYGYFPPDQPRALPAPALPTVPMRPRKNAPTQVQLAQTKETGMTEPRVEKADDRFNIYASNGEYAGFSLAVPYNTDAGGAIIFPHTEIFDDFGGQGLASILVRQALDAAIKDGQKIISICPYVTKWIREHEGYSEHTMPVRPDHLEFLRELNQNNDRSDSHGS